jgi:hypothetical protein
MGADGAETTVILGSGGLSGSSGAVSGGSWELDGTTLVPGFSGGMDFALAPQEYRVGPEADLIAEFNAPSASDATGHYAMSLSSGVALASSAARKGASGVSFRGDGGVRFEGRPGALFGANGEGSDFSIEFWLYPFAMSDGEIVLSWRSMRASSLGVVAQQALAVASGNSLSWSFVNFLESPDGRETRYVLSGRGLVVPKRWSHHLVRYDSGTGELEYLVDGRTEAVTHATSTGNERGTPYLPRVGTAAPIEFCPSFRGYADCLRIASAYVEPASLGSYGTDPGAAVSPVIDLGTPNASLYSVGARRKAEGGSGVFFYYRLGESPYALRSADWIQFDPDKPLPGRPAGRYLQFRLELMPGPRGESTPTVSYLSIRYEPDSPPAPPSRVVAIPGDSQVTVRWTAVPEGDVVSYVVYYGYAPGEYSGVEALEGRSPVSAGPALSLTLRGLVNGRAYYFAVVAVDRAGNEGKFSQEASARPSKVAP